MKIRYILPALGVAAAASAVAAPANPAPFTVIQPDGAALTITLHGDEHFSWLETADGRVIEQREDGWYVECQKPLEVPQRVRKTRARLAGAEDNPTTGTVRGLVILAEFPDVPFSSANTRETFQRALNEEGYSDNGATGSVRDYFIAQSGGVFTPEFDVVGPVRLSNEMSYYGADANGLRDINVNRMINEACMLADEEGTDFTLYDSNRDGTVDLVYVIYSGYSQSNGASTATIWPHMWFLSESNTSLRLDGVIIDRYACSSERAGVSGDTMAGIGLFCHEFSHTLGLPDVYDVTYSSSTLKMGPWDVMDSGCYNNSMRTPAGYSAYEKSSLGWIEPTVLTAESGDMTLPALNTGAACRLQSPANTDEYFLLETRTLDDPWDAYLPGEGMLITHVDYDEAAWEANQVNTGANWRLHLVPANGDFSSFSDAASAPFPGAADVRWFTDLSTPSSVFNDGTHLELPLTAIEYNDGVTTFTVGKGLDEPQLTEPTRITETGFRANWDSVEGAKTYILRLRADGSEESNTFEKIVRNYYTLSGLDPDATYFYSVKAVGDYLDSGWSEERSICLRTAGILSVSEAGQTEGEWYTLQGIRVSTPSRSIHILRTPDGTTKKISIY